MVMIMTMMMMMMMMTIPHKVITPHKTGTSLFTRPIRSLIHQIRNKKNLLYKQLNLCRRTTSVRAKWIEEGNKKIDENCKVE